MSEQQAEALTLSVGNMLATARQRQGLSQEDVAQKLKLKVRQIEALELGHYEQLPGELFVRGFVRGYARLVGADETLLLQTLSFELKPAVAPAISAAGENIALQPRHIPLWLLVLGLVLVIALLAPVLVYYGLNRGLPVAEKPTASQPAQPVASAVAVAVPAFTAAEAVVASASAAASTVQTRSGPLQLSFTGDSWVEVYDAQGKRVFYQLGKASEVAYVDGTPPLDVVIGNASSVKVTYLGKPVDLAPHTKISVARLKLQ